MRTRTRVLGISLFGVAALLLRPEALDAAPPPQTGAVTIVAIADELGEDAIEIEADASSAADATMAAETDATTGGAVLGGLSGAATALAAHDSQRALALADALVADPGTALWFAQGAIQGRAQLQLGRPAEALAALRPRVQHKALAKFFPPDVLGVELAQAQLAFARLPATSAKDADAQLDDGVARLKKLSKAEPIRNFAQMKVLQAQMLSELSGASGARKAVSALEDVLQEYPHHPERGRMWLEHARALERAGRTKDAMEELRAITIERTGEPEGTAAWEELQRIASSHGKSVSPLSQGEKLASANAARRNKRVEESRELLDELIDDPKTPAHLRTQAEHARSVTAAKQRDFATCADHLRKAYAKSGNLEQRDDLLKCLEKGGFYDEAIDMWVARANEAKKGKRGRGQRTAATWNAVELAVRGGKYERARELLRAYETEGKAHGAERAWLHPWLAMRLGNDADAIAAFEAYEKKHRGAAKRAKYFRAKLQLESSDPGVKDRGRTTLLQLAAAEPFGYYGLMARSRLVDDGEEVLPTPKLAPVAEELKPPRRADAEAELDALVASHGAAWPSIVRARQLYVAGYNDEARRELRVTVQAFLTRGKKAGGVRNEDILVGLGWKPNWKYPRVAPTKEGRKTLRDKELTEKLRKGLREIAFAMQEPHAYVKLSTPREAPMRARWTLRAFRPAVEREARLRKIDPKHMWALMYTESRFRPHVVSPVGARGALQIMPWTAHQLAERLGETDSGHFFDTDLLFDIDTNAHLSAYYVAELLHKFHGQAPMAYASYNGGPSNVARWLAAKSQGPTPLELDEFIEEIPFNESYKYTKRVMEVHATYSLLYEGKLPQWSNTVDPAFEDNIHF